MSSTSILLVSLALSVAQTESREAAPAGESVHLTHCVVTLIDEVQVPARDAGVLKEIAVREGDTVKSNQVVAQLDDTEARASLSIAEAEYKSAREKAENDVRLRAAQADAEIMELEYLHGDDLPDALADDMEEKRLRRLLLAPRRAHLQTDVARLDHHLAQLASQVQAAALAAADSRLRRHGIESPLDGEVVRVYRNAGEWVSPGDAIVHVVRMDRLRVEGFVRSAEFAPEEIVGRPVTVTIQVTRGQQHQRRTQVAFASPLVETNGQYRIFVDVQNIRRDGHWLIRPGLMAEMVIHVGEL